MKNLDWGSRRRLTKVWKVEIETRKKFEEPIIVAAGQTFGWTTGRKRRERQSCRHDVGIPKSKESLRRESVHIRRGNDLNWIAIGKFTLKGKGKQKMRCWGKDQAWIEWSENLNTVKGRTEMFRLASQMKKDKTDILATNFIKNEEDCIKVEGGGE